MCHHNQQPRLYLPELQVAKAFPQNSLASIQKADKERDKLVDILSFCLMPNHFHLVLRQVGDSGVSVFMQKLGTGYSMYFNAKRKRSGSLFQGPFKAVHIDKENYINRLMVYVHLNPADLIEPKWKEVGLKNWQRTHNFVKKYTWSSYGDYLGENRFNSILSMNIAKDLFGSLSDENIVKNFANEGVGYLRDYIIDTIEARPL